MTSEFSPVVTALADLNDSEFGALIAAPDDSPVEAGAICARNRLLLASGKAHTGEPEAEQRENGGLGNVGRERRHRSGKAAIADELEASNKCQRVSGSSPAEASIPEIRNRGTPL